MAAVVLPKQRSRLSEIGDILNTIGGIPRSLEAQDLAFEKERLSIEELKRKAAFQKAVGDVLGMPAELPGAPTPSSALTPEGQEFNEGYTVSGAPTPNVERAEKLKALKEVGPFYGVKTDKTLDETLTELAAKSGHAQELEKVRTEGRQALQTKELEVRQKIEGEKETGRQIRAKGTETTRAAAIAENAKHRLAQEEIAREGNRIRATGVDVQRANTAIASKRLDAWIANEANKITNSQEITKMKIDAAGGDDVDKIKDRVTRTMQSQLEQIRKLREKGGDKALLERAVEQYNKSREQLANISPEDFDPDEIKELTTESPGGIGGVKNYIRDMFGGETSVVPKTAPSTTPGQPTATPRPARVSPTAPTKAPPTKAGSLGGSTSTLDDIIKRARETAKGK